MLTNNYLFILFQEFYLAVPTFMTIIITARELRTQKERLWHQYPSFCFVLWVLPDYVNPDDYGLVYVHLDTCCGHFLTIIAGVDLHFRYESKLPVPYKNTPWCPLGFPWNTKGFPSDTIDFPWHTMGVTLCTMGHHGVSIEPHGISMAHHGM